MTRRDSTLAGLPFLALALAPACYTSHDSPDDDMDGGCGDGRDCDSSVGDADAVFDVMCSSAMSCTPLDCPPGMVFVPCGPFVMGSGPEMHEPEEQPAHVVCLSSFCIDRIEVAWEEWDACVAAGGCDPLDPRYCPAGRSREPVSCIYRNQAAPYCAWKGGRLPTEAQWEKAARGGCEIVAPETCGPEDMGIYPWGDVPPTCELANFSPDPYADPRVTCTPLGAVEPVDSHPAGASPYDVLNMAGNAEEVVADEYYGTYYGTLPPGAVDPQGPPPTDPPCIQYRGGGSVDDAEFVRLARRRGSSPCRGERLFGSGFRCTFPP